MTPALTCRHVHLTCHFFFSRWAVPHDHNDPTVLIPPPPPRVPGSQLSLSTLVRKVETGHEAKRPHLTEADKVLCFQGTWEALSPWGQGGIVSLYVRDWGWGGCYGVT